MLQQDCSFASLDVRANRAVLGAAGFARFTAVLACGFLVCPAANAQVPVPTTFVPQGSTWAYLDNGSDQGTAWRDPGFDDSKWLRGPAELGYGDGGEATVIDCGPAPGNECNPGNPTNKFITTYFRTTFHVAEMSMLSDPSFLLRVDDGAVIYLNGAEVGRLNLPDGEINYLTETPGAITEYLIPVDPTTIVGYSWTYNAAVALGALVDGTNVLAVEVHQDFPVSSDVSFDLEFRGFVTPIPEPATGTIAALSVLMNVASRCYRSNRRSWARRIPSALSSPVPKSSK